MSRAEIKLVGVARRRDGVLLASTLYTRDTSYKYMDNVNMLLTSGNLNKITGDRLVLRDDPNTFYVFIKDAFVVLVITSSAYPLRPVYPSTPTSKSLMSDLLSGFTSACGAMADSSPAGGCDAKARPVFKAVVDEFSDLTKVDNLAAVESKIAAVTSVMEDSVKKAVTNLEKVKQLDEKADHLRDSSAQFQQAGRKLKLDQRCRYYKRLAMYGGIALTLLAVIIIIIVVSTGGGSSK